MEMAQYTDNRSGLRIHRELTSIKNSKEIAKWGIAVEAANDNLTLLRAQLSGPSGTPYEGGNFILEIKIPKRYPFKAPNFKFATKIWHPNICSATGEICLCYWMPSMRVIDVLFAIQAFLSTAEPDEYMDSAAAKQYREDREKFIFTARHWTQTYAGAAKFPIHSGDKTTVAHKPYEEKMELSKSLFQIKDRKAEIVHKQFQENSELSKSPIQSGIGKIAAPPKIYKGNSEISTCNQDNADFGEMVESFVNLRVDENKIDSSSSWNLERARAMLANLHF